MLSGTCLSACVADGCIQIAPGGRPWTRVLVGGQPAGTLPQGQRNPHVQAASGSAPGNCAQASCQQTQTSLSGANLKPRRPLCGEAVETQGHVLLACKALEVARIQRHHRAGRLILEAIRTGAHGGDIICADLGSAATCQEEGTHCYPTFAEAGLLPPAVLQGLREAGFYSVPDAVLKSRGERGKRDYVSLLELKYCRDGMEETAHGTAAAQHSALETAIHEAGYDVHMHTIALGIAGTVDASLPSTMAELGVPHRGTKLLIEKLNKHAVQSMAWVWGARLQRTTNRRNISPAASPHRAKGSSPRPNQLIPQGAGELTHAQPLPTRAHARVVSLSPPTYLLTCMNTQFFFTRQVADLGLRHA